MRKIRSNDDISYFFGYDPVNDQYKVLWMMEQCVPRQVGPCVSEEHQVFTLGAKKKAWRMIECKLPHVLATNELCKDGVIYYGAWYNSLEEASSLIVSFDVRSEEFGVIKLPKDVGINYRQTELVNYHGNIALVDYLDIGSVDLWVLQDVKKQEWSKIFVLLPHIPGNKFFYCTGTSSTGEIIFAPSQYSNPFFLIYYDLKGNNVRRVDIEGVRDSTVDDPIRVLLDHVENPMVLEKEV